MEKDIKHLQVRVKEFCKFFAHYMTDGGSRKRDLDDCYLYYDSCVGCLFELSKKKYEQKVSKKS